MKLKKYFSMILLSIVLFNVLPVFSQNQAYSTKNNLFLPAETPVVVKSEHAILPKYFRSGYDVRFSVVTDIKDLEGNVLIGKGTPVSGKISKIKDAGCIGKSGYILVDNFQTETVDNVVIPLMGSLYVKPNNRMALSIVLSCIIFPLFLFMKGDEAYIPAGTSKVLYTGSDVYIKSVSQDL